MVLIFTFNIPTLVSSRFSFSIVSVPQNVFDLNSSFVANQRAFWITIYKDQIFELEYLCSKFSLIKRGSLFESALYFGKLVSAFWVSAAAGVLATEFPLVGSPGAGSRTNKH